MSPISYFSSLILTIVYLFLNQFLLTESSTQSLERFSSPNVYHYSQLLFDTSKYKIIVGARDYLLQLSLNNFNKSPKEKVYWPAREEAREACKVRGQSDELCRNYVKVLLKTPSSNSISSDKFYVCGTNAFHPECNWRKGDTISVVVKEEDGKAKCPFSPKWNTTSLMTSRGDYYYGGRLDFMGSDPAILKDPKSGSFLRTTQMDRKLLNVDTSFVASFETDKFVYFIFKETAVEEINCGNALYSRIGRVCKNDGGIVEMNEFSTFLKTRLNCSIPGHPYPFYFNEIDDATYDDKEKILYGVFTTPENSIHGSAVCAFEMDAIVKSFEGPFKYQKTFDSFWEGVRDKEALSSFNCGNSSGPSSLHRNKYQLMNEVVGSYKGGPLITETNERIEHLAVDKVFTKFGDARMIFVLTAKNKLRRYVLWPHSVKACYVNEIQLNMRSNDTVLNMKLLKDLDSLYIGTIEELIRVSVSDCSSYKSQDECLLSNDPYCGWDSRIEKCTEPPSGLSREKNWFQKRERSCITHKWTPWSDWSECEQFSGEGCLCRYRTCKELGCTDGPKVQVSNCTQNGEWTDWGEWSNCSVSCGTGIKVRSRTCTNPSPKYGGRPCYGQKVQKLACQKPPCVRSTTPPSIVVKHHLWSDWGQWESCSAKCGDGVQLRRRKCLSTGNQISACSGCDSEWRLCNSHRCKDAKKSLSTPWVNSGNGSSQERFHFVCSVSNFPEDSNLSVHLKQENKEGNVIPKSKEWTFCSAPCGNGHQFKWDGKGYLERVCNTGKKCRSENIKGGKNIPSKYEDENNSLHHKMFKDASKSKDVNPFILNQYSPPNYNQGERWSTLSIVICALVSLILGTIVGASITFIIMRKKYGSDENTGMGMKFFSNKNKPSSNAYVTASDFKTNNLSSISATSSLLSPNVTLARKGSLGNGSYLSPNKEATIKRASTIRAKLNSDQNF